MKFNKRVFASCFLLSSNAMADSGNSRLPSLVACFQDIAATHFSELGCSRTDNLKCLCNNDTFMRYVVTCLSNTDPTRDLSDEHQYVNDVCISMTEKALSSKPLLIQKRHAHDSGDSSSSSHVSATSSNSSSSTGNTSSSSEHGSGGNAKAKALKAQNRNFSIWMASMLLMYFGAIIIVKTFFNMIYHSTVKVLSFFDGKSSRKIRKQLLLPPLSHRGVKSQPFYVRKFGLLIPQRQDAVIVFIWICLFTFALSYNYFGQTGSTAMKYLGVRTAYVCVFIMPLFFLFGGRNNFLMWCTGWTMNTFNVYHKWIARAEVLCVLIHAGAYAYAEVQANVFATTWRKPYMWWGFIAMMSGMFICIQAMHWFRQRHYESFLIIHIVLALIFVIFGYYHCKQVGHNTNTYLHYYFATFAVWGFDRAARLVRLLYSGKATAEITFDEHSNVLLMEITHANRWKFYPGAYAYIYFSDRKKFWQSHPFTLYESPTGKLMVGIRVMKGITKDIAQRCMESSKKHLTINIGLEGPYGSRHKISMYNSRVFIAGGIGFTAVYAYALEASVQPASNKRTTLLWVVKEQAMPDTFAPELDLLKRNGVEVRLYITGSGIKKTGKTPETTDADSSSADEGASSKEVDKTGRLMVDGASLFDDVTEYSRPNLDDAVSSEIESANGPVAILCCGPGSMNDAVRHTIVDKFEQCKYRVDFFEDNFGW